MPIFYTFLLVFLPVLSFLYFLPKISKNKSRCNPPGPLGLPLIGNLHQIDQSSLHTSFLNLSKSYGPIVFLNLGFIPSVVVSSASLAKEVLKTQDLIFCNRPSTIAQRKFTYNKLDVVFSPYNDYFKQMKKLVNVHVLGLKRVQHSRHIREDEVTLAMNMIHDLAHSSKHVNVSEIAKNVMSTIVMRVGFGKRYEDGQERTKILGLIAGLQGMITNLFVSDLWPGMPFVGLIDRLTGQIDRLEKCFQDLDSFYQELIDERVNAEYRKCHEDDDDIIDILIQLKKDRVMSNIELTDNHIKAMLTDVLVAGTDASAAIVIWAMTSLIKNPQIMKKTQDEVRNVVGKKGEVNEDDLRKLTYLKTVTKEIMRLYPPAPLLVPRETNKDTILHGYEIKQKTMVHVNAWAIGRDPELWENPEEFLPERFLGSEVDFRGNDFELIPFGGGRRICPGISMGVLMAELLLANLVYLFDWSLLDGVKIEDIDYEVMPGLTMHKKNDLCLLAHVYLQEKDDRF
ncbi:6,7,8-trihydroxycoumarin synthase-like [Rutidosis leptorrhynchoides]|uniref:6,7,8-trihydroxycoumarin synthase-like n=1 Tax=Rutidosis leptorrhynchoides TaxID=125765 RepID=UPI003A99E674